METIFRRNFNETLINLTAELSTGLKPNIPLLGSATKPNNKNNNSDHINVSNSKNKNNVQMANYAISSSKQFKDLCFSFGLTVDPDYLNIFYDDFTRKNQVTIITFEKFKEMLSELLARKEILELYLIFCEEEEKFIDFYAPHMSNKQLQEFFRSCFYIVFFQQHLLVFKLGCKVGRDEMNQERLMLDVAQNDARFVRYVRR